MADSSMISLTKAAAAQIVGNNILYLVHDPEGTPADYRVNLASILGNMYKISPSVASNNLTVAVQHLDGSAPSANSPLVFKIGDSFLQVTGALSFTKNAATNWCGAGSAETAGLDVDFFVYAINETGASAGLKIGFSRISHARTMSDFINTSTSYKYIAGSWTNFNATDTVINIGRFRARLSATAAFNWSIPTALVLSFPYYATDWLYWTPTHTGFSVAPTGGATRYRLDNGQLTLAYNPNTAGASSTTAYTLTLPFTARNLTNYYQYAALGWTYDNSGNAATGTAYATPNSNVLTLTKSALGAWTGSGNKAASFSMALEIE